MRCPSCNKSFQTLEDEAGYFDYCPFCGYTEPDEDEVEIDGERLIALSAEDEGWMEANYGRI